MAVAVRLAPGVGDDLPAFASRAEAILEPVTVVGGDVVFVRILRSGGVGEAGERADEQGKDDDAETQWLSSNSL